MSTLYHSAECLGLVSHALLNRIIADSTALSVTSSPNSSPVGSGPNDGEKLRKNALRLWAVISRASTTDNENDVPVSLQRAGENLLELCDVIAIDAKAAQFAAQLVSH
jgi:hypothetical protein